ncbi:MAG: hypothetical protein JWO30_892 [Fibrobacteres bacterium]|nr:hypothetical protein [Fibrobacterota bacterium]
MTVAIRAARRRKARDKADGELELLGKEDGGRD